MKNYHQFSDINSGLVLCLVVVAILFFLTIWSWVNGVDYMKQNYPDYRGEDLFGEDTDKDI